MPIIAQEIININVNDDLTVTIIDKIKSCGCIQTSKISIEFSIPLERLKKTLARIAEKNELKCDDNFEICCSDKSTFDEFVKNLNELKGE